MNILIGLLILVLVFRVSLYFYRMVLYPGRAYLIKAVDLEGKRIYVKEIK